MKVKSDNEWKEDLKKSHPKNHKEIIKNYPLKGGNNVN